MSYIHKRTGARISYSSYKNLDWYDKEQFVAETSSNNSGDFLTSTVLGAVTDSALVGGLLGGNLIGGLLGDCLDGDLSD